MTEKILTPLQDAVMQYLRYYTPEAPVSALEIADEIMKANGVKESRRRRVREMIADLKELRPNEVGSCPDGYFLIRTPLDREISRRFISNHALSELHTARKRRIDKRQEAAL